MFYWTWLNGIYVWQDAVGSFLGQWITRVFEYAVMSWDVEEEEYIEN
jgi:hypothetical protein